MRIIAGKYKGRKLSEFQGDSVRPTSDRAREGVFSVLQFELSGKKFLDGFSGSGAVGIEAISRGASEVVFTDISKTSCELTKKNLKLVGESAKVINTDCLRFLSITNERFDIIFLDPPYKSEDGVKAAEIAVKRRVISDDGIIVLERGNVINELIDGLFIEKKKKYGIAEFAFYRVVNNDTCVFAGSFDPVTKGHVRIVCRALEKYKNVIVALGVNENKKYTFDRFTRLKMLHAAFDGMAGVTVEAFDGLLVDFLKKKRITANVRGVRNDTDMAYEDEMYAYNKELFPEIKNVYLPAEVDYRNISSTIVKQLISSGKDYSGYLPKDVADVVADYFKK